MKPLASQFSASVGYLPAIVRAHCRASDFSVLCKLANEASSTTSSFSERDESNTETLVKTTYDTSYSTSPIDVDYWSKTTVDSHYEYEYDHSSGNATSHSGAHRTCEETSRSEKETSYRRRGTFFGDVVEHWSSWNADGSGSQSYNTITTSGDYSYQTIYTESYEFDFDGSWSRNADGTFSRVPIVIENAIVGSKSTIEVTSNNVTHTTTEGLTSPISSTSFSSEYGSFAKGQLRNLHFSQVDGYAAERFGDAESQSGYTYTPSNVVVATWSSFQVPFTRYDFDITYRPSDFVELFSSAHSLALSESGLVPAYNDATLEGMLSSSRKEEIISQIQAEIEAKYAETISTTGGLWSGLASVGKFIYDAAIGDSINLAIKAYKDMVATGANPFMAVYTGVGVFLADQVGIVSLSNAVTGEDLATGRQLSTGERWMEGVSGAFSLVTTATGGLGQVKNAIRSTGKCGSLGKYFTNCCFTGDVEVLVYLEEPIAVPVANGETISIEPTPEDDASKDVAATVSVAPVNLAIDERDMSPEYALAALSEPKSNALSITNLLLCVTVAGGAATCAAYAWDKRRVRERAFAEYGAEDAEPDLTEVDPCGRLPFF